MTRKGDTALFSHSEIITGCMRGQAVRLYGPLILAPGLAFCSELTSTLSQKNNLQHTQTHTKKEAKGFFQQKTEVLSAFHTLHKQQ